MLDDSLDVNANDNTLAAEAHGCSLDELRIVHRSCIDRDLVRSSQEEITDVIQILDPSADGERHKDLLRGPAHHVKNDAALFVGGGDVQEREFVRPLFVIELGVLDGVSCIDQVHETDALYDTAALHIEARYDSFCQHLFFSHIVGE